MSKPSSAAESAEHLAARIERAYRENTRKGTEVLVGLLAEDVEVVHEPRQEGDGMRKGADLRAMRLRETDAFEKALENFREDVTATGEGDLLVISRITRGLRRSNGDEIAADSTSRFRVANGRIVQMLANSKSGSFSVIADIMREGGFTR